MTISRKICKRLHGNLKKEVEETNTQKMQEVSFVATFAAGLDLSPTKSALAIKQH